MAELMVNPHHSLVDEPLEIRVHGLEPGEIVVLQASLVDLKGMQWASWAKFRAGSDGSLDLATAVPLEGSYDWPDPMGLVWSMELTDQEHKMVSFIPFGIEPHTIRFCLKTLDGTEITQEVQRIWMKTGVQRQVVRENGLFGTLFLPAGAGPHPALILVSGSGGGLSETRAALFASRGFATLALAYFNYESLPKGLVNIPLEYFKTAIQFLQDHPHINAQAIGVTGGSRGGELSLLLGATFPQIHAVAAYVPSGLIWSGFGGEAEGPCAAWTWHGEPLPWIPEVVNFVEGIEEMIEKGSPIPLTPGFLRSVKAADPQVLEAATIPVENTNGAILLISGEDDQMWPSTFLSQLVVERLERRQFPHSFRHISYPNAGHAILTPITPLPPPHSIHPVDQNDYAYGGLPREHAFATSDAWQQTLFFFGEHLQQPQIGAKQ